MKKAFRYKRDRADGALTARQQIRTRYGIISGPSVKKGVDQCRALGDDAFIKRYRSRRPITYYLDCEIGRFPLKAICAAAHRPPTQAGLFTTDQARGWVVALGFKVFPKTKTKR
jgi:hypothetical protein